MAIKAWSWMGHQTEEELTHHTLQAMARATKLADMAVQLLSREQMAGILRSRRPIRDLHALCREGLDPTTHIQTTLSRRELWQDALNLILDLTTRLPLITSATVKIPVRRQFKARLRAQLSRRTSPATNTP